MAKTIFMIHGMWQGPWCWDNYSGFFQARGYRCIPATLRHHDMDPQATPPPQLGTTSLLDYAGDLEEEIRQLDEKPIVMGHSMGGFLAQVLGSRGLATALVVLTPAAPAGIMAVKPSVIRSFWSVLSKWGFWRKPVRQSFEGAEYATLHLLSPEERRQVYDKCAYESGRAVSELGLWLLDPSGASRVDEPQVTCPVLVVGGAEDRITPVSITRQIAEKYSSVCTYKKFADHAHYVLAEPGWEEIAAYVYGWLEQSLGDPA